MSEHVIADTNEIPEGERVLVQLKGREIGIFNVDGDYYAYTNWCAHQGGPCCEGSLTGTIRGGFDRENLEQSLEWSDDEEILNCPWHGWEYEIKTGECLSREGIVLPRHEIEIQDGQIIVHL